MDEWTVYVTSADVRAAREAWETARDRGDAPEQVASLHRDLEALWRLQAYQFRTEFHRHHNSL